MRRLQRFTLLAALAALTALLGPASASAQPEKPKAVEFVTADGVELHGTFYPSSKAKARTVLMLHDFGEHSRKADWVRLAKSLQAKGYAVLTFDFRGHGESTKVTKPGIYDVNPALASPGFWDKQENQFGIRGYMANNPKNLGRPRSNSRNSRRPITVSWSTTSPPPRPTSIS